MGLWLEPSKGTGEVGDLGREGQKGAGRALWAMGSTLAFLS